MVAHFAHDLLGYAIGAGVLLAILGASYWIRRRTLDTGSTPDEPPV